jgi:aminobenzoyl-glutamate transport protein
VPGARPRRRAPPRSTLETPLDDPTLALADRRQRGFLGFVERVGNVLPDPVMIFVWLIGLLMVLSAVGAGLGWSASLVYPGATAPPFGELAGGVLTYRAQSLFAEPNVARLLTEAPRTLTGFAPLGLILLIMFGAGVAERVGLFSALIRRSLRNAPRVLLTPAVCLIGMVSHHASDAGYVVFIPLAALLYAAAGRHPLAGLAAAFAAVSGGHAGNLTPGQGDVLLFGFTQEAARIIDPAWTMNPLGNWWFIVAVVVVFTPVIWFLTDRVIEPRLGRWDGGADGSLPGELAKSEVTSAERRGLAWAGLAALAVVGGIVALCLWPGYTPLIDEAARGPARLQPFYTALIAALFAAHFIAMFNWSRLGPIAAINGAEALQAIHLPAPVLLVSVLLFSSFLDLFIGSASAKWSALAPVVVPMFMLLGISPEMTQAAYRMGDSFTNIMTPLMSYFPLVLVYCRRWDASFGVGSLLALMLPYALSFAVAGIAMTAGWVFLDLPLGPGAAVHYTPPGGLLR